MQKKDVMATNNRTAAARMNNRRTGRPLPGADVLSEIIAGAHPFEGRTSGWTRNHSRTLPLLTPKRDENGQSHEEF
jgi:hypothetical protein